VVLASLVAAQIVGALFALPLVGILFRGEAGATLSNPYALFLVVLIGDLALVGIVWLLVVRRRVLTWGELGLARRGAPKAALRGVLWGILFIAVAGVIQFLLALLGVDSTQGSQFPLRESTEWGRIVIWAAGVVLAPVAEEIFFRGYMFRAMSARGGLARGLVFSSALFALVHFNVAAFLPLAVGAAVLALGFRRTGSLWTPIVAHALNNAFAFAILTLTARG
jgi:uncharacterized protein